MMKYIAPYLLIVLLLVVSIQGCEEHILDDEPGMSPVELFDQLWSDVDEIYSYFLVKNIDWDSVYSVHRRYINSGISKGELFDHMAAMLNALEDGHVNLYGMGRGSAYTGWFSSFPVNYYPEVVSNNYLLSQSETPVFLYGQLNSGNFGYIHIRNFGGQQSGYQVFGDILNQFKDSAGLILDLRNNSGGSTNNSKVVASHFVTESSTFAYIRYKNGPAHSDFTEWVPRRTEAGDAPVYTKPVVLLTNRRCFSTTEFFILNMRILANVTVVGDTTGGGAGNPIFRELPNGWTYRVSRWQEVTDQKRQYEGTGLYPDIPVWTTRADSVSGKDLILDRAINYLQSQM